MKSKPKSKMLAVRDVDPEIFQEFKSETVKEGLTIGKALNQAMEFWMSGSKKKPKMSIAEFKPSKPWPKGTERLSEEIDKVLYGGE